jgi:nicotinate-nucleotide pyrophosphorylase (carboxylating)
MPHNIALLPPLPDLLLEPLVRQALLEDLGRAGDITTDATIPVGLQWQAVLAARQEGVVAGLDLARIAFHLVDPAITITVRIADGHAVKPGEIIATVDGPARGIITAERVALNFLCRMSGIATATRQLTDAVKPYRARICCTRKTTPGLRLVEKYAVRAGGGSNHRFGLDDAILIKDNHIAASGGVVEAVTRARAAVGHLVKIELEVDTLDQLRTALALPEAQRVDAVLLDNMNPETLKQAVVLVAGNCVTEASGRVNLDTVNAIAASGVDRISVGWITHSAPILDIGLDEAI